MARLGAGLVLAVGLPLWVQDPVGRQDAAVYEAVLRFAVQQQLMPASVAIVNRTVTICRPEPAPAGMGCIRSEEFGVLETRSRGRRVPFAGRLTGDERLALARALRQRNETSQPIPSERIAGAELVPPARAAEVVRQVTAHSDGIVWFSRPAYTGERWAVVWGAYVCGGRCGYGWLFLVERQAEAWRVAGAHPLWIS